MKAFGPVFLLILFIAACADDVLETQTPSASLTVSPTEIPIIDLKITLRPPATIAESDFVVSPTPTAPLTPTPEYLSYIIASGDTLMDIAVRFGTTIAHIEAINPGIKAELLLIGQEINLPSANISTPEVPFDNEIGNGIDLEIVGLASYLAPVDNLWVLGAVRNNTSQPVGNVQVNITISDQNGQIVGTREVFTQPDIIFPGEMSPFAANFESQVSEDVIVEVSVIGQSTDVDPKLQSTDLILEDTSTNSDDRQIFYEGAVRNTGSEGVKDIIVSAIFFDEMGQVIGYRMFEIENIIGPGESTAFSDHGIGFNDRHSRTEWAVHGTIVGE